MIARRYVREVYPTKAIRTRADNDKELIHLLRVFGQMPIDAILPMHIRQYMDLRGQVAPARANREKALFSHIFNKAREWGYTAAQNPCQGVKGFKERGRSRYITDVEFGQVKAHAHFTVVDAMDLALLTGQRRSQDSMRRHSGRRALGHPKQDRGETGHRGNWRTRRRYRPHQ
ncbi:hypothetical protein ACFPOE_01915 [Caenimonas terrae]|uniref:Core-binding (CB) domain-containing protein n=1 Tax=Caenimonas terrae TaxID=696074 RepID=A0ABW0N8S4_9BURK